MIAIREKCLSGKSESRAHGACCNHQFHHSGLVANLVTASNLRQTKQAKKKTRPDQTKKVNEKEGRVASNQFPVVRRENGYLAT